MTASENGIQIIKDFEGLVLHAYKDPGSKDGLPITIGYGSTMYKDGSKIKLGDTITEEQAEDLLRWEVGNKTSVLRGMNLKLNQNQFDAVSSLVYNIGIGAFENSTLLKKIRYNPNDPDIRNQFGRWIYNDGKILDDLVRRRKEEADLYFKPLL
jgi:lysozyme